MKKSLKYRIATVIMETFKALGFISLLAGGILLGWVVGELLIYHWKIFKEMNLEWVILLPIVPILLAILANWCQNTIEKGRENDI
jgi:phosphate/sulfate permease